MKTLLARPMGLWQVTSRTLAARILLTRLVITGVVLARLLVTSSTSADESKHSPYEVLDQLARVLTLVEREYVEPVERSRLLEGAIKGMVSELDPHSAYLPKADYAIFRGDTQGRFGGVGVEVDFQADHVTVIAPIEGSPAARAGILPGDHIIAIDRLPVSGHSAQELVRIMRGEPGSKVMLTVRRAGSDALLYFELTREIIEVASVAVKRLEGDVAYVRIKAFQEGSHEELVGGVALLRRQLGHELTGIVLDLRSNPGGLVDEAVAIADEFLTGGVIYTTRHRGIVINEVVATVHGAFRTGPVVVLVNEYSASAAELVAGALQDQRRATIVGARTFGKGSVQSIIDLPGGDGLKITTMRYYTPAGFAIQARGITPDVLVDASYLPDRSFGVIRESDLENHLTGEAGPDAAAESRPGTEAAPGSPAGDTHLGVTRDVPSNPVGGNDLALSIGYQIVRGVLGNPS